MSKPTLAIYGIKDRNSYHNPGYTHDHNLCLMQDGVIIEYLQLERYTRKKYDNRLDLFIEEIFDTHFSYLEDFDLISVNSFVGNSFLSQNGRLRVESPFHSDLIYIPEQVYGFWEKRAWEGKEVQTWNLSQEMAHIGTCLPFFGDFQENSLLIHFDGGASVSNFSAFYYKEDKIQKLEAHWELGYLSKFFNDNAFSFSMLNALPGEHCSVPGKLMGFAGLGKYCPKIEAWLTKNNYFREYWNQKEEILRSIQKNFPLEIKHFHTKETFFQDVAATLQFIFERETIRKIQNLQEKVQADFLYYSGGCALNIVTNTKILESGMFRDCYIPPCPNDSGLSIGAASILERMKGNTIKSHSPYLNSVGIKSNSQNISNDFIQKVTQILDSGKVIGVCNGYGEIGPRALGNRSIIALPNSKELARVISEEKKQREWYRPIAPVMLKKNAELVTGKKIHPLGKYMLLDWKILREFRNHLEGVIHKNQTSRIQIIEKEEDNPFLFHILTSLDQKGIMGLINTSFNGKGEPIVHTEDDAQKTALSLSLDAIIINQKLEILNP